MAIDFNQIDGIVGKSLVKPESDIFLSLIDHSFEECRKVLKAKQREGSIIHIKLMSYTCYLEHARCGKFLLLKGSFIKRQTSGTLSDNE